MLQAPVPHKGPLIKSRTAHSCNTSPQQSLTNHSFTAKESTRTTTVTAAHTQTIWLKDSQARQRLQQRGKHPWRKDPPNPEKLGVSWLLTTSSQIRKCKAGDSHIGTASLYYCSAWDGAGQKNILEFQVVPVQYLGPAVYTFPVLWKELVLEHHAANVHYRAVPQVRTNSDSICTIVIWALHRYARKYMKDETPSQ